MADKTDRGTTNDPVWGSKNLTGGNDSGASSIDHGRLDEADGPDLTARLLAESGERAAGSDSEAPRVAHRYYPGSVAARSHTDLGGDEVTDESGRIAAADVHDVPSARGGARDPRVTGTDTET